MKIRLLLGRGTSVTSRQRKPDGALEILLEGWWAWMIAALTFTVAVASMVVDGGRR